MAKKRRRDVPPLAHQWLPPEGLIENGVGQPQACLATTYEFNASFFEAELLPRFLGQKFDHTENEASFLVEREEALELAQVAVLVDQSRLDSSQTTMRWDQIPVFIPGGILHAKIVVLAWERLVRVLIGSANLTRKGYRRNREIVAALDFWNDAESVPLQLLYETLDLVGGALAWARVVPGARERVATTVERIRDFTRRWELAPREFSPRQRPRVAIAATHPSSSDHPSRSALVEFLELWNGRRAAAITVVTPFVGQQASGPAEDPVVAKLLEVPRSRDCEGYLVVPELPATDEAPAVRVPIPQGFGDHWKSAFAGRGGAYVLPLPPCVEGRENRNRDLHAKVVALENESDALMLIGSSNFTPRGMGIGVRNFEANLVFEDSWKERRGGLTLLDRLDLPRDWNESLKAENVTWQGPEASADDEPSEDPVLPPFFAWSSYSQATGELRLGVDRQKEEPAAWSVRLPGTSDPPSPILFAREPGQGQAEESMFTYAFPAETRGVHLVALLVEWDDAEGSRRQAKLAVCAESKDALLPPGEFRALGADAILECLISGKSPSQWFDQQQNALRKSSPSDAAVESLRSVDTSGYLLYRVRQFGRALGGMGDRILGTSPYPDAIRYRLLKDPFGPLSLAKTVAAVGSSGEEASEASAGNRAQPQAGGWCACLGPEHRLFLLAEILLTVEHLRKQMSRRTRGKERSQAMAQFDDAERQLIDLLNHTVACCGEDLPENLRAYLVAVKEQATAQAATLEGEVEHAR
jgi:phosphatidylserine/phosphatidylglycerophosphate/cardiolipin synthase-like enzyme